MTATDTRDGSLVFLPLGGAGEIGMNLSLYGHAGKWLMVDLGITFADETLPGIDILMPDPAFIEAERDDLVALVLTHAHEDHLGAVPHLWPRLRCPVYATRFAAALLHRKLVDAGLEDEVDVRIYEPGDMLELAPFRVTPIGITHSIPESMALAIETAAGTVLHTGDWKLDDTPLVGPSTDREALRAFGDKGVLALVCDSTNVFNKGKSGSEAAVREGLLDLLKDKQGRIAVTTFASNVARFESVAHVARALERHLVIVGRSLWRIHDAAREAGYLRDLPPVLSERDFGDLPRDKVLLLCTGCQGEAQGAMARIANGDHRHVHLSPGDTVVFSSRIIPGNERTLFGLHNKLARAGIEVVTEKDHFVHVSGHPAREELAEMYRLIRPQVAVPVHGEARHLAEHAGFAKSLQVPHAMILNNGDVLRLAPGEPAIVGEVPAGRLALDGDADLVAPEGELVRRRRRLMYNGVAVANLVFDREGELETEPAITLVGVAEDENDGFEVEVADAVARAVESLPGRLRFDDDKVIESATKALRGAVRRRIDRRPHVEIRIARVR